MGYNYFNLRDKAWQLLIDCNISSLPVDIDRILDYIGVTALPYQFQGDIYGAHTADTIYYSADSTVQQMRFTVAHEIGHVYLAHDAWNGIEKEANSFAARLLMPAGILHEIGATSATQIATICNVSILCADWRAKRMQLLHERNRFASSSLEQQLLLQFSDFIENYKGNYGKF